MVNIAFVTSVACHAYNQLMQLVLHSVLNIASPIPASLHVLTRITACHLPPTFQSWFTITNLHVWLLTVRLRALPTPHGTNYVQGLIDHFFLDVEDRIRAALSKKAPERVVTRQMKIFREQWNGLGLTLDYALGLSSPYSPTPRNDGDAEMAAAAQHRTERRPS